MHTNSGRKIDDFAIIAYVDRRLKEVGLHLTPDEKKIFFFFDLRGMKAKKICTRLCISKGTLNAHRTTMYQKMRCFMEMERGQLLLGKILCLMEEDEQPSPIYGNKKKKRKKQESKKQKSNEQKSNEQESNEQESNKHITPIIYIIIFIIIYSNSYQKIDDFAIMAYVDQNLQEVGVHLTPNEKKIFFFFDLRGMGYKPLAVRLNITERTLNAHRIAVYQKMRSFIDIEIGQLLLGKIICMMEEETQPSPIYKNKKYASDTFLDSAYKVLFSN